MNLAPKKFVKQLLPPFIIDCCNKFLRPGLKFKGPFQSWADAETRASGYDAEGILKKIEIATDLVISGDAKFERDGVAFNETEYAFPLIATLLRAAIENDGKLTVLDFGGALGSSYYQCLPFLAGIKELNWYVIEQSHFVKLGVEKYQQNQLKFYADIHSVNASPRINVVMVSGVLQYLEKPVDVLQQLANIGADYLFIDRTPISVTDSTIVTLQIVPSSINQAIYPAWFFSKELFGDHLLNTNYLKLSSFDALEGRLGTGQVAADFKGYIYKRELMTE